jgi:hypothetical protein
MNSNILSALKLSSKAAAELNSQALHQMPNGCAHFAGPTEERFQKTWLLEAENLANAKDPRVRMAAFASAAYCQERLKNNAASAQLLKKAIDAGEAMEKPNLDARFELAKIYKDAENGAFVDMMVALHKDGHKVAGSYVAASYLFHPKLTDAKKAQAFISNFSVNPCETYQIHAAVLTDDILKKQIQMSAANIRSIVEKGKVACGDSKNFDENVKSTSSLISSIGGSMRIRALARALSGVGR